MSDRIEGVAILDETSKTAPARLHFVCVRANGDLAPWSGSVPVRPLGSPEIPGTISWEFKVDGAELAMQPSVKMSYVSGHTADDPPQPIWREYFHNEGQWRVLFVRWERRPDFANENGGDVDWEAIRAKLKALNPSLL